MHAGTADHPTIVGEILQVDLFYAIVATTWHKQKSGPGRISSRDPCDDPVAAVGEHSDVAAPREVKREVRKEIRLDAAPATVFALLTDARRMMTWLARDVMADPRVGGIFRLADLKGLWIEGIYLEVVPYRTVAFSWGGIEGLTPGQSMVQFTLQPGSNKTVLRLCHSCLTDAAADAHHFGWTKVGLPKLKAVAEGREVGSTCLDDVADLRERYPCPLRAQFSAWGKSRKRTDPGI